MEKEKITSTDIIVKIVLIIIIFILLIHNCSLLKTIKEKDKEVKPSGNIDIFEIVCEKKSCDKNDKKSPIQPIKSNGKNNKDVEQINVTDDNIVWKSKNQLRIFSNPFYDMDNKIAPGDSNTYQFAIINSTNNNIMYNIDFIEINNNNINMKYRLRRNNEYLINDYVSYNELKQQNIKLGKNSNDTYYLEWKWFSSEDDNDLANIKNAYELSIEIEAQSINE